MSPATQGRAPRNPNQLPSEVLVERLFRRISEVSSLPQVAFHIIEVANDQSSGAEDLLQAVQFDAALATRIMRTVNSSYYSLQNKVGDLKLAITLLGFKEIRNLAITAYVSQLFKKGSGYGPYTREGLWNHMVGVGAVARTIAESTRKVPPREAYLAGLLHDLGLILIDQYLHQPFRQVLDALYPETPLRNVEQEVLGFDHAELGEFVAGHWNLPDHLTACIRYHHNPLACDGPHREMAATVSLANFFCHAKNLSSLGVPDPTVPPAEVFTTAGLDRSQVAAIWDQLDATLESVNMIPLVDADS